MDHEGTRSSIYMIVKAAHSCSPKGTSFPLKTLMFITAIQWEILNFPLECKPNRVKKTECALYYYLTFV